MDKIADTMFILEDDGSVSGFVGKCSEYLQLKEELGAAEEKSRPVVKKEPERTEKPAKKKRSFNEQREFESLESEIMELEEKKSLLEAQMSDSDFAVVQKASVEYQSVSETLDAKYARWEELAELG
jgi:ATP-binding cassette subfamily F protein uup